MNISSDLARAATDHVTPARPAPRVLLVGPWPPTIGGVTSFMLKLEASGVADFTRFTTSRPPKRGTIDNWGYAAALRGGLPRIVAGAAVTARHLAAFPAAARRAGIVQVQASDYLTFWESAYYVRTARALGRPVILRLGGGFDHFYAGSSPRFQSAIRSVLRRPERLIVQSDYWRTVIGGLGRTDGVVVVPNWVPDALTAPVIRPPRAPTVLFIAGTEARRKGIDTVLACAAATPGVHWRIVAAPSLPARANVATTGKLAHAAMLAAMRDADILVMPSRAEGFPNALVEAMALGLPCVATPVGAVPEILQPMTHLRAPPGLLTPVDDAAALTAHVTALAADPDLRRRIGAAAREVVRARYTATRVLDTLRALYAPLNSAS